MKVYQKANPDEKSELGSESKKNSLKNKLGSTDKLDKIPEEQPKVEKPSVLVIHSGTDSLNIETGTPFAEHGNIKSKNGRKTPKKKKKRDGQGADEVIKEDDSEQTQ